MTKLNAVLSLLSVCITGYGCAAPTAGDDQLGYAAEAVQKPDPGGKLLALGDSIAFGYNPFADFTKVKNFDGYPEVLKDDVSSVKNASCPGETSGSLISATAPDNGCRAYRNAYPLHVDYDGSQTQLEYGLSRITSANPDDVPTLVTLNVSGNDIFLLQQTCATVPDPVTCFRNGVPGLIGGIAHNVGTIFGTIRAAGYTGRLVFMTLYTTNYNDQNAVALVAAINQAAVSAAHMFGAEIADGFGAFLAGSAPSHDPCTAGLLILNQAPLTGCDVHPSATGTDLLADSVRNAQ